MKQKETRFIVAIGALAAGLKQEMQQMQLQFFTNISHEFRTPLSLILGPLEKLQKENTEAHFSQYYNVMHRNVNRMLQLITELMDFRKAETGSLKLKVMPGNLSLFLKEIEEEFRELANEKKYISLFICLKIVRCYGSTARYSRKSSLTC